MTQEMSELNLAQYQLEPIATSGSILSERDHLRKRNLLLIVEVEEKTAGHALVTCYVNKHSKSKNPSAL